ncbi:MAG: hypothetical protein FJW63_09190 [Actinobacteria bacterium]|nr:hypothetical protein [Actinomycetota bacterium]
MKNDALKTFRRIKEEQEKDSQNTYKRTRFPANLLFNFLYFRLFDIFYIENVDNLLKGLKKLFPDKNDSFFIEYNSENFIKNSTGISSGEWLNIGYLVGSSKNRFLGQRNRVLKELPSFVDYIHIELHKVLPSFFTLSYDVHLKESVTQELIKLHNSKFKSEITFRKLIPYGKLGGGYSTKSSEIVMRQEILTWISSLQIQVELYLKKFLKGKFFEDDPSKSTNLPCIEIYVVGKFPESKITIRNWIIKSSNWLESLGFHAIHIDSFTNNNLIYIPKWYENRDKHFRFNSRLLASKEDYIKTINLDMYGKDENLALSHNTQGDFLTLILPTIVILEMITRFKIKFEKIRSNIFSTFKSDSTPFFNLNKDVKLSSSLLQTSVIFDRISKEFDIEQKNISAQLEGISDFSKIGNKDKKRYTNLNEELLGMIMFKLKYLKGHVEFADNWLSKFLVLRNLSVTFFLALIAIIVAIISLLK